MSTPVIRVVDLGKRFSLRQGDDNSLWALRNVSFEVASGEVLGVIGRNGAGKSTLLKILSRITEPTEGRAELRGRVRSLLEVGTGFHPELSGRENVYLNGAFLGMRKREIDHKLDEIAAFAEVERFLDTPVKRYSSGMYMRLAFSVAAHLEPEILVVDEVLAVGDLAFQRKCLGKMEQVAGSGRTVLFVSHNTAAAERLCNRAIWLDQGRLVAEGAIHDVLDRYVGSQGGDGAASYQASGDDAGEGGVSLREAHVLGADGERKASLRFGEPFAVRAVWDCSRQQQPGACYFVRILDERDTLLTAANTLDVEDRELIQSGRHELVCYIDDNVLTPGRYRISVGMYLPNRPIQQRERCLAFEIQPHPFDGAHRFNITKEALFATRARWEHALRDHTASSR